MIEETLRTERNKAVRALKAAIAAHNAAIAGLSDRLRVRPEDRAAMAATDDGRYSRGRLSAEPTPAERASWAAWTPAERAARAQALAETAAAVESAEAAFAAADAAWREMGEGLA